MIDIIFHDKTGVTPYNPGQTGGFENAAGSGEIHYYRLFDGVGIMLLRLRWRPIRKSARRSYDRD